MKNILAEKTEQKHGGKTKRKNSINIFILPTL